MFEEGLAVYYSTSHYSTGGETPSSGDIELFAKRFAAPDVELPAAEYSAAGRFMGFLVRRFGLETVFEVCSITGIQPDAETLASAMTSVLGASPEQLLAELVDETQCDSWSLYQSRVFACGEANAARSAGVVDDDLLLRYRMGCDEETTVGRAMAASGSSSESSFYIRVPTGSRCPTPRTRPRPSSSSWLRVSLVAGFGPSWLVTRSAHFKLSRAPTGWRCEPTRTSRESSLWSSVVSDLCVSVDHPRDCRDPSL